MTIPPFSERVKTAIKDDHLHEAIERATGQLKDRRSQAFASLSEPDAVRDRARATKLEMLRHLDEHLLEFESRLQANGVCVHWARTGQEANEIILDIAKAADVRNVVKSKSMVTEETHLNKTLIGAGLDVVETDLGEYIVQLADDTPSHIILPIIHMT